MSQTDDQKLAGEIQDFLRSQHAARFSKEGVAKPEILDRVVEDWEKPIQNAADRHYTNALLAKAQLSPEEASYLAKGIAAHLKGQ
jgi:hypothetical protein